MPGEQLSNLCLSSIPLTPANEKGYHTGRYDTLHLQFDVEERAGATVVLVLGDCYSSVNLLNVEKFAHAVHRCAFFGEIKDFLHSVNADHQRFIPVRHSNHRTFFQSFHLNLIGKP